MRFKSLGLFFAAGFISALVLADDARLTPKEPARSDTATEGPVLPPPDETDPPLKSRVFDLPPADGSLRFGKILIDRKDVFETGSRLDNKFPYNLANKVHIVTKERFVRNELLFKEGDLYNPELVKETERLLRSKPILRSVKITAAQPVNGLVDVRIETADAWTTNVNLSYGLEGGEHTYTAGFLERNFLGQGKSIGGFVKQDIDRFVKGMSYRDRQLFGSRWELQTGYGQDEKGRELNAKINKPFYSLATRFGGGVEVDLIEDEDRRFENGDEVVRFQHDVKFARVNGAFAVGPNPVRSRRLTLAHEYRKDEFGNFVETVPFARPVDHDVSAVLLGYEYQRVRFLKEHGVVTFDRDEDINLGWRWMAEAGPSLEKLGATRDGVVGRSLVSKVWRPAENHFWFTSFSADGRYERKELVNTVFRANSHYAIVNWYDRNSASLRAYYAAGRNIDDGGEFLLGAENGLRGYSVRQFSGNKKAIFILENRNIFVDDWLNLATVGGAVFFDAGAAWDEHERPKLEGFKSDVGAGLRFALTRSVEAIVIRTDVAYALNDNLRSSPWVLSIGGEVRFGDRREPKFEQ